MIRHRSAAYCHRDSSLNYADRVINLATVTAACGAFVYVVVRTSAAFRVDVIAATIHGRPREAEKLTRI